LRMHWIKLYELVTSIFHVILGFFTVHIHYYGLIIACIYVAYEILQSKTELEYVEDLLEYATGIALGIGIR